MLVGSDVSLVDDAAELLTACYSRGAFKRNERPWLSCQKVAVSWLLIYFRTLCNWSNFFLLMYPPSSFHLLCLINQKSNLLGTLVFSNILTSIINLASSPRNDWVPMSTVQVHDYWLTGIDGVFSDTLKGSPHIWLPFRRLPCTAIQTGTIWLASCIVKGRLISEMIQASRSIESQNPIQLSCNIWPSKTSPVNNPS